MSPIQQRLSNSISAEVEDLKFTLDRNDPDVSLELVEKNSELGKMLSGEEEDEGKENIDNDVILCYTRSDNSNENYPDEVPTPRCTNTSDVHTPATEIDNGPEEGDLGTKSKFKRNLGPPGITVSKIFRKLGKSKIIQSTLGGNRNEAKSVDVESHLSQEDLDEIKKTLVTLTDEVPSAKPNQEVSQTSKYRSFFAFRKKKHAMGADENQIVMASTDEETTKSGSNSLLLKLQPDGNDSYSKLILQDSHSTRQESDMYLGVSATDTDGPHIAGGSKDIVDRDLEKKNSHYEAIRKTWVFDAVCRAENILRREKVAVKAKNAAQAFIIKEVNKDPSVMLGTLKIQDVASQAASLIVSSLTTNISKEQTTSLTISVLSSKGCYTKDDEDEGLFSVGSIGGESAALSEAESIGLERAANSESFAEPQSNFTFKFNPFTQLFTACFSTNEVDVCLGLKHIDPTETLEGLDTIGTDDTNSVHSESSGNVSKNSKTDDYPYSPERSEHREDYLSDDVSADEREEVGNSSRSRGRGSRRGNRDGKKYMKESGRRHKSATRSHPRFRRSGKQLV